jgi:hypothetical protein
MNIGNILKVADAIEASPMFGMAAWCHCVAGHAGRLAREEDAQRGRIARFFRPLRDPYSLSECPQRFLGIDGSQARELFIPPYSAAMGATRGQAARCLRNLVITGRIDWKAAMKPADPKLPSLPNLDEADALAPTSADEVEAA